MDMYGPRGKDDAEAVILNMGGQLNSSMALPASCGFGWPADPDFATLAPANLSEPSIVPSRCATLVHQDLTYQPPNSRLSEPQAVQAVDGQKGAAARDDFQGSELMDFDDSLMLAFNQESNEREQTATQHSCHGSPSRPTDISTLAPSNDGPGSGTEGMAENTGVSAIVDPLAAYCSSVIRREAEMAGVATAVADYVAWMRNVPSTGAPPVTNAVYQQMLQNIEIRVRELADRSLEKHEVPLKHLLGALGGASGGATAARVAGLEKDLQRQMRDQAAFFKTEYNACKFLADQTQTRP